MGQAVLDGKGVKPGSNAVFNLGSNGVGNGGPHGLCNVGPNWGPKFIANGESQWELQ